MKTAFTEEYGDKLPAINLPKTTQTYGDIKGKNDSFVDEAIVLN